MSMRARYCSPSLKRFLNPDPIGFSGGNNWFTYADGNPISANDPMGLATIDLSYQVPVVNPQMSKMGTYAAGEEGNGNYGRFNTWNGKYFGQYKCNCFTHDVAQAVGIIPPIIDEQIIYGSVGAVNPSLQEYPRGGGPRPARPSEFVDSEVNIPGWTSPVFLDENAIPYGAMISDGIHIGISTGPNSSASVRANQFPSTLSHLVWNDTQRYVVNNDWQNRASGALMTRFPLDYMTQKNFIITTPHSK